MKKYFIISLSLLLLNCVTFAQTFDTISNEQILIKTDSTYERSLPPNIVLDEVIFEDENNNGILEANESALLTIKVANIGKGPAQGLNVVVNDDFKDTSLVLLYEKELADIRPNQEANIQIKLIAGPYTITAVHKLEFFIDEYFGYDSDPVYLILNTNNNDSELANIHIKPAIVMTDNIEVETKDTLIHISELSLPTIRNNLIDINKVPNSKTARNNSIGIIIGIENYDSLVPVPYAKNDAYIMEKYFKYVLGIDSVYVYLNDDVVGYFFDNMFNNEYGDLKDHIIKDTTDLFIFYSGHGIPSPEGNDVYLFPSDGRISDIETQGYSLYKFYKDIYSLGAHTTTVFIDACFNGSTRSSALHEKHSIVDINEVSVTPRFDEPWKSDSTFAIFLSSSLEESTLGRDSSETGLFTYFLCAGMQGKADSNNDNKITSLELSNYIIKNVHEVSLRSSFEQTPLFFGNGKIELIEY